MDIRKRLFSSDTKTTQNIISLKTKSLKIIIDHCFIKMLMIYIDFD